MTDARDEQPNELVAERLERAFAAEVAAAERHIASNPLVPRRTSGVGRAVVVALVVVLAISGGLALRLLGLTQEPGDLPTSGLLSGQNDIPAGMVVRIAGESVLTVPGALERFAGLTDDTQLLVGGWLEQFEGYCDNDPLMGCKARITPSMETTTPVLWASFDGRPHPPAGWAVVRVHTHDKRAAACAPELRAQCDEAFVVDDLKWSLPTPVTAIPDESATPSPTGGPLPSTPPADDPIPASLLGLPVVRVGDLDAALTTLGPDQAFVIGGWVSPDCGDGALCVEGASIGAGPGGTGPHVQLISGPGVPALQPGPSVVQVRPREATLQCQRPPDCLTFLIVERILWQEANGHVLPLGAPHRIAGEPVLTVFEGHAAVDVADGPAPFLVGGWFRDVPRPCPKPIPGPTPTSPLVPSCQRNTEMDEVDAPDGSAARLLTVDVVFIEGGPAVPQGGPVVLRVHVHDPLAAGCLPEERATCERQLVVEEVVWTSRSPGLPSSIIPAP